MKKKKTPVISREGARDARIVAALRLGSAIATAAVLVAVAHIIGSYAHAGQSESYLWIVPCAAALVAALFAYTEMIYGGYAARAEEKRIRRDLLTRLFASNGTDENTQPGKVVQMLTDNTERVTEFRQVYLGSSLAAMAIPFVLLAYVGIAYDPLLGFGIMAMCPLIPVLLILFMRFFRKTSAHSRKERAKLAGQYLDAIRNLVTIRLLGAGPRIEEQLRAQGEKNRGAIMRLLAGNQLVIIVIDGLFSLVLICATAALALVRFQSGNVTLTQVIATMLLTTLLIEPLVQVAGFFYIGMGGMASQKAIRAYYEKHPAPVQTEHSSASSVYEDGTIHVENVSYDYGRGRVLNSVSLDVKEGERVAIVGRSGAGKSTLLGLMRGSLALQSGSIQLCGNNVKELEPEQIRKLTASVAQATWLFTGTIADNLRIAKNDASEEEMWEALKGAQVAEEVRRMSQGLHSDVGEQASLISGGQAQRISIARALLSGRKVLLLDEPTSQVDIESEARIIEAIRELGREWTVIIVTHRKALLEIVDRVYEMSDGQLTEMNQADANASLLEHEEENK